MVERVSTYAQSTSLAQELMRLQSKYATEEVQASSGLKSDNYEGIATDTGKLLNLESQYTSLTGESENAQIALNRVNTMSSAVSNIIDLANSLRATISGATSGSGSTSSSVQSSAESTLSEMASLLNTEQGGDYLFGGSAVSTAPVNLDNYSSVTSATSNTSYYQGNDYVQSVKASSELTVDYGVTADNSGFEQIMRAIKLAADNPTDTATLNTAYDMLGTGIDAVTTVQTQLANQSSTLDNQVSQNADDLNLIDNMISDIKNVDLSQVSVSLSQLETQIQASYSLTAKLANLNLADYLK